MNFAVRGKAPALFMCGINGYHLPTFNCLAAAFNHYAGEKEIRIYEFNMHEGGASYQDLEKIKFLKSLI